MKTKAKDLGINLVESFSEFKDFKNIDRATMMRVLEDVFRNILKKKYGQDANFDNVYKYVCNKASGFLTKCLVNFYIL